MEAIQHSDKIMGLFGRRVGSENAEATALQEKEAKRAREEQKISLARSLSESQRESQELDQDVAGVGRIPRGRRLLLSSTGEAGVRRPSLLQP